MSYQWRTMGCITLEDAEAEPESKRLFPTEKADEPNTPIETTARPPLVRGRWEMSEVRGATGRRLGSRSY